MKLKIKCQNWKK